MHEVDRKMTLNFASFNSLGTSQKMDAVWQWAFLLGKRGGIGSNTFLYVLNGFFVEVFIKTDDNTILHIEALDFLSLDHLQSYAIERSNPFLRAIA